MERNKKQFGYSDIRLWSFYLLLSSSMLLLTITFGAGWSLLIVAVASTVFLRLYKKHDRVTWVDRYREIDAYVERRNTPKPKKPVTVSVTRKSHPKRTSQPLVSLAS